MESRGRDRTPRNRRSRKRRKRNTPPKQDSTEPEPPNDSDAESHPPDATPDAIEPDMTDSEGEDCELHTYDRRFDARGENVMLRVGTTSEFEIPKIKSHRAALLLFRTYRPNKELQFTDLVVRSKHIKQALREVIKTYPGVNLSSFGDITIPAPPMCLFHYRTELEAYAAEAECPTVRKHVNLCLDYMTGALKLETALYNTAMDGPGEPSIEHRHLWMAFKPGCLLYETIDDMDVVSRLREINSVKNSDTGDVEQWELVSENIYHNGRDLGYGDAMIVIEKGPGPKVQHRVIVDHQAFTSVTGLECNFIPGTRLIEVAARDHLNLPDEETVLCLHRLGGFDLARREWVWLNIDSIRDIQFNSDAFNQLVFPQAKKNLIQSLVEQHDEDEEGFDDLIKGKGRGLTFLLHGPPGVGKTFTAESIADYTRRPLLQISSGELMGDASAVENKLAGMLARAQRWKALVLIDEADVFMQERKIDDLERNSLVSVLLRVIEYFEGILFLTTNRVQTIDRAFHSRIHLSFAYPPLSTEALQTLWKSTIIRGCSGNRPKWLKRKFLKELATSSVSGRDIKNIVRMAHAMARSGKREIMPADIQQGLDALQNFGTDFRRGLE
ncbi:hypothetical protein QQX98_007497 [Neonectria punicea]|uniref:AAA+ ATPase domain-containing protein n=1 Tax=Neonectria punicea TaxID=979145 RepID=A0ABR1GXS8_9HYPO